MQRREFIGMAAGLAFSPTSANAIGERMLVPSQVSPPDTVSILHGYELQGGICLLDVGDATTEASAYRSGACMARVRFAFGENTLIDAIRRRLDVDFQEAQEIIARDGHAFACLVEGLEPLCRQGVLLTRVVDGLPLRRELTAIIQAEIEGMFAEVREFLGNNRYDLAYGVVVHGRVAAIPGIVELGEEVFHSLVRTVPTHETVG